MTNSICLQVDSFFDNAPYIVKATLTNGTEVFLDDGRPGAEPSSAWLRLRQYCLENGIKLDKLGVLCHTGYVQVVPDGQSEYFCISKMIWVSGASFDYIIFGYVTDGKIVTCSYNKNPFTFVEYGEREPQKYKDILI